MNKCECDKGIPCYWGIKHKEFDMWWSNWWGWVDDDGEMDVFTSDERNLFNLPVDGEWIEL